MALWIAFEYLKYQMGVHISGKKHVFWIALCFLFTMSAFFIASVTIMEIKKKRVCDHERRKSLPLTQLYIFMVCTWSPAILGSVSASIYIEELLYAFSEEEIYFEHIDVIVISVVVLYIITWLHVYVFHDGVELD